MKNNYIKKLFFIPIILLVFFTNCKKEIEKQNPNTSFGKVYPIEGNQNLLGSCKAPDGGYLLWGYTDGNALGGQDGFLMRLDSANNLMWYKQLGGSRNDIICKAAYDKQGNIVAGGESNSFNTNIDTTKLGIYNRMYVVYVTDKGDVIWEKTYTDNSGGKSVLNRLFLNSLLVLQNGNIALVGSTINFDPKQFALTTYQSNKAYIQCINNLGDELWNCKFHLLDIDTFGVFYSGYNGVNAMLTKDGNILMLLCKDISNGYIDGSKDKTDYSLTLLKISPNITTGENKYIWRKPIKNLSTYLLNYKNQFIPFPIKMIDTLSEKYMMAFGKGDLFNFGTIDKDANIIASFNNHTFWNIESSLDFEVNNNSIYFLTPNYFSKVSLNGVVEWEKKIIGNEIKAGFGIYFKPDKSITTFCTYLNAQSELDIATLILNENGVITK